MSDFLVWHELTFWHAGSLCTGHYACSNGQLIDKARCATRSVPISEAPVAAQAKQILIELEIEHDERRVRSEKPP
jgi:hypothetical protein